MHKEVNLINVNCPNTIRTNKKCKTIINCMRFVYNVYTVLEELVDINFVTCKAVFVNVVLIPPSDSW